MTKLSRFCRSPVERFHKLLHKHSMPAMQTSFPSHGKQTHCHTQWKHGNIGCHWLCWGLLQKPPHELESIEYWLLGQRQSTCAPDQGSEGMAVHILLWRLHQWHWLWWWETYLIECCIPGMCKYLSICFFVMAWGHSSQGLLFLTNGISFPPCLSEFHKFHLPEN